MTAELAAPGRGAAAECGGVEVEYVDPGRGREISQVAGGLLVGDGSSG